MAKKEKEIKTNAMRLLEQKKIPYTVHTYDGEEFHDGVSVADMLGQPHEIVYKTLVTVAKSKEHYVFVIPIEAELDLKKAARAVHEKSVEMLPLKELTDLTGYVRGGCTCIGMKKQFPAVLDESAKQFPRIMVSGGRRGSQIEVNPEDLMRAAGGDLCRCCDGIDLSYNRRNKRRRKRTFRLLFSVFFTKRSYFPVIIDRNQV